MDFSESVLFTVLNSLACWNSEPFNLRYPKVKVNLIETGFYEPKPTSPKPKNIASSDEIIQLTTSNINNSSSFSLGNELPSTQDFNFDKWIKGEGPTLAYSQSRTPKGKISWNMLLSNDFILNLKPKKVSPSSSLVSKRLSVAPPSFNTPIPVPELFDVKRCCPSYFFPEQQRQTLCSQGWFKDESPLVLNNLNSFKENIDFSQYDGSLTKHLEEYKNYKNYIEKNSCLKFDSIGSIAQAQIVYRYYVEILFPSFSKNLHVITYMNISCHRLISLLKDLVIAPQDFVKNTKEMENFLNCLHKINPKACLFLFHYLSNVVLDFIEVPEENYTDESVWRKVALWLSNLHPGQSDSVLKTHFIQRCPRILEQTFKFPEDLDKKQTLFRHGFRSSSHLSQLKEFLLTSSPESIISSDSSNESLEEDVPIISETKESTKNNNQNILNPKLRLKTPLPEFPDFEDIEISDAEDLVIDDSASPMLSGFCLSDAETVSKESRFLSNTSDSSYFDSDKPFLISGTDLVYGSTDADQDIVIGSINLNEEIDLFNSGNPVISSSILSDIQDRDHVSKDNGTTALATSSQIDSSESVQALENVKKTDSLNPSISNYALEESNSSTHTPTIFQTTHFCDPLPSIPEVDSNQSINDNISSSDDDGCNTSNSTSSEEIVNESIKSSTSYPNFPNIFSAPEISGDFEFESDEVYTERMYRLMKAYAFIEGLRLINKSC